MLITALFSSALILSSTTASPVSRQQVHSVEADYVRTVRPTVRSPSAPGPKRYPVPLYRQGRGRSRLGLAIGR